MITHLVSSPSLFTGMPRILRSRAEEPYLKDDNPRKDLSMLRCVNRKKLYCITQINKLSRFLCLFI